MPVGTRASHCNGLGRQCNLPIHGAVVWLLQRHHRSLPALHAARTQDICLVTVWLTSATSTERRSLDQVSFLRVTAATSKPGPRQTLTRTHSQIGERSVQTHDIVITMRQCILVCKDNYRGISSENQIKAIRKSEKGPAVANA